jgi:hypothetical protein
LLPRAFNLNFLKLHILLSKQHLCHLRLLTLALLLAEALKLLLANCELALLLSKFLL